MRQSRRFIFDVSYLEFFGVLTRVGIDIYNFWEWEREQEF